MDSDHVIFPIYSCMKMYITAVHGKAGRKIEPFWKDLWRRKHIVAPVRKQSTSKNRVMLYVADLPRQWRRTTPYVVVVGATWLSIIVAATVICPLGTRRAIPCSCTGNKRARFVGFPCAIRPPARDKFPDTRCAAAPNIWLNRSVRSVTMASFRSLASF